MNEDRSKVSDDFKSVVNMTSGQLKKWLETDESKKVGFKTSEDGESVGHHSGRRIIEILARSKDTYTDDDFHHMAKVVGYVHRHLAQRPEGEIEETPWRYSLMNWGHDPAKEKNASKGKAKSSK